MAKVFRIYKGGNDTYEDWKESPNFPYNQTNRSLENMVDPGGDNPSNEITSIPSPFARIDLVKNAFREVVQSCKVSSGKTDLSGLSGTTIYNKMVSDTLDVAEIFFNIDKYEGIVEILPWNPAQAIDELKDSDMDGHYNYADALEKFMKSDSETYNFDLSQNFYLLNYLNGESELNIIGSTSPATLFFCSANDLQYVGEDIVFGQDKPFDSEYQPLYKRDIEFVKSLFLLRKINPEFAAQYPEVNDYLDLTLKAITDPDKKKAIRDLTEANATDYEEIIITDNEQQNIVEVNTDKIYKRGAVPVSSDFEIAATRELNKLPLVLPVESGTRYQNFWYVTDKWGNQNKAPFKVSKKVDGQIVEVNYELRTLPGEGTQYPYLTISDFLEDNLIPIPHGTNKKYLFDGNLRTSTNPQISEETTYLLPVKDLFFRFFHLKDLYGNIPNTNIQKKMFEMEYLAGGGVKVTLRIPVKGNDSINFIEYTRTYYKERSANVDESHNDGALLSEKQFSDVNLLIMPCVEFSNPTDGIYRVFLMRDKSDSIALDFYNDGKILEKVGLDCRNKNGEYQLSTDVYVIDNNVFDVIKFKISGANGLIIPKFKGNAENESYTFAVDLGTTNTHVEYKKTNSRGNCAPLVFNTVDSIATKADDEMAACLFLPRTQIIEGKKVVVEFERQKSIVERDIFPSTFNSEVDFHFPTRTMMSVANSLNWDDAINTFGLANIAFAYCKRSAIAYNKDLEESVKWGTGGNSNNITKAFIENLLFIIRNKVVLNNGKLSNTTITWFYPASMATGRRNNFAQTWNNVCQKYFGNGVTVKRMTESEAPVNYFFEKERNATDMITVDIGGGTTDIAFAKDRELKLITSFRFAANTLFENALAGLNTSNGIVDYYKDKIHKKIEGKNNEIDTIFAELDQKPAEMASFLFGLKENLYVDQTGINKDEIDFLHKLQEDGDFKIVFILFYSAIIYHIAQIIKSGGLDYPRHIAFSGNGSKAIKAISPDEGTLALFTKKMIELIVGRPYDKQLSIIGLDKDANPKESTCKGGMYQNIVEDAHELIKVFMCGSNRFSEEEDTYEKLPTNYQDKVKEEVQKFFKFVLEDMNKAFKFGDNFEMSQKAFEIAKGIAFDKNNDISTYLQRGVEARISDGSRSDQVGETFFFYPIIGLISDISDGIYNSLTKPQDK